ncbi:MAG: class I SAM-dependent methyltransferase [Bacteroidales bacterium]|nr:class I SAM-dependent methyltransferase [Bacteroidales bacterium]
MVSTTNMTLVRAAVERLIHCGDDFQEMKLAVESLYEFFKSITGIDFTKWNDADIHLPSGKAISAEGAAHCLLEFRRTAIFLRGIKQAVDSKVDSNEGQIKILYAGCGPYATLITPLLHYYSADKISVTLLDVNSVSLNAAEKLINELRLGDYIEQFVLADAATYKVDRPYDIVISETMQAGLKNEPQVAIAQNLIPQCSVDTIFIPERITIDAYLRKRGIWDGDRLLEEGGETNHLGELFTVSKANLDSSSYRKVITLPQTFNKPYDLLLYTTIKVFGNEVLGLNDCSLNLPLKYFELREGYTKTVEFWYNQSNKPKIESKILDYIS